MKVGEKLPEVTLRTMTAEGPAEKKTGELFAGKKAVLFGVPGAFTPTCHKNHLAGFIANADQIKAKGVDLIAVTGVNDPFVMGAWEKASNADGKVLFLADGSADFAKAAGMDLDLGPRGLGTRSRRYAAIVEDGTVTWLGIEETPATADQSGAEAVLKAL